MPFLFESLDVYKKSLSFMTEVFSLNPAISEKNIRDQLQRAALSIPLNIAEGQGRIHGKEKRQFFNTARGSLLECVPLIQVSYELGLLSGTKYQFLYSLAEEIGKMLTGLIKSVNCD
jgi:four helix bundle protein